MRSEYLKFWLAAATPKERPGTSNWELIVEIIQTSFRDGRLPLYCKLQKVLLLPKGNW